MNDLKYIWAIEYCSFAVKYDSQKFGVSGDYLECLFPGGDKNKTPTINFISASGDICPIEITHKYCKPKPIGKYFKHMTFDAQTGESGNKEKWEVEIFFQDKKIIDRNRRAEVLFIFKEGDHGAAEHSGGTGGGYSSH